MFDPELAPQKGIDLQNTLQAKIDILNSKTAEKQFDTATMEAQLRSSVNTFQEPNQPLIPYKETLPEAAARGVVESVKGIPMLASGVVAGGALVAEKIVGEGGIATKIKEAAAGKYHKIEQDIGVGAQPEDSFTYSYEKAKEGDWKALVSWFSHGSGYVAGQLTSLLVGSGIIKTGVELTGKKAISKLMGGLVKKEADRIAKQQLITQGAKVTTENIAKVAATDSVSKLAISSVTSKAGTHIGMASAGFGLEGGEIFGTLSQEADVTWKQIQKAGIATGLAGAVEYLDLLFNVKALKGGLSTIGGLGKKVSGVAGKATRVGVTAGKVAPVEFAEEYAQTAIEQWGTGKNPFSAESRKEQFDAGMLGSLGGPVTSVGGVFTRSEQEQQESTERKAERKALRVKANPKAQLGYEDKLSAAVETEDISMHKDNPVLAAEALQQINQKKDLDPSVKITNHDKAIEIHNAVDAEFQEQIKEVQKYQAIKEERELTKEEGELAVSAMKQAMASKAIIDQIVPVIDSMGREETASPEKLKEVKTILKGSDSVKIQEAILTVFGSKGDFTDADINEVLNNPKIDDITKVKFKRILSYQKSAKATLEGQKSPINKTSVQVNQDIINGRIKDKFKGIKGYLQSIAIATQNKDTKLAKSQLSDLQAFTERHAIKADLFRRLQDAVIKAKAKTTEEQEAVIKTFSAADQKFLEQLNTERASIGYNADYDFNTNFEASIQSMEREADSLSEALSVAQDMITPPQAQPTAEKVVQSETEEEEISAATAEDVSSEEVGSNEQPLSAEQEITSLVKTNKGKWVTVDFPKYTGTFKAQVTGNVIPDSFSIVNGVKTVTGYSIEIKTNTGKVLTATAQELGLKAYKTDQDIETTTPVQEDFVVEEEDTFFGQDESETFLTLEEMTKAELQTLYQNTEKTNTDRRQEIEAVLRTKHATEKKPKKEDGSKPEENADDASAFSESEPSEKTLFRGQEEAPYIDDKGNLVLTPTHDSLFKNTGISFAEDKELAEEYGNRYSKNPFIIQINIDYLDKIFPLNRQGGTAVTDERVVGDEREQRIVTKKDIIIPKGQYSVSKKNIKYDHSTTATSVLMDELDKENYEGDISEHLRYGEVAQGYASNEQEYYDSIKQELKNRNFSETDFAFISNNPITTDPDSIMEALGIDPKTNKWKNSYNTEYQNRRKQLYEKTASEKHTPLAEQLTDKTGIDRESLTPGNTNNTDLANNRLWVNTLRAFFKPIYGKAGPKSLLNKIPDFVAAMRKKILSKNHSLNPDQEKAAIALMKFNKEFSATLLKTFKPKANEKFFYEDAVNYFRVNGELNPNFLMAMSATAWKWLATQGPKTLINDDKSIRKIFNLKESQEISEDVRALVSRIGASKDYLSGTLGKDVIKMFEIKATQDIGVFDRELIEQDLGTLLLATLDRMGRVERTQVNAGRIPSTPVKTEKITLGFYGLRNHMLNTPQAPLSPQLINTFILPDQRLDVAKEDVIDRKNTTKVDFFRIASKVVTLKDGTSFEALTNANTQTRTDYEYGKGVWEQLFKLTADPLDYSFTKPTWENDKEKWPLARTSEFATIPQTNNLKQYIEQPYGLSHGVMNIFTFLTNAGQRTAAGAVNINDATHDRHKHRESINRKIELDLDAVRFWLHNAKKETAKYASNFFIQSYFIATGRMQQAGPIQPQNSMTHRFLFKNKAWEATFDKSDEQVVELFKAAVGLSLGVDPTKEASMAIVQQKTTDILESPVIQSALAAIDVFLSAAEQHTEYSPDEMVALRKAQPDLEADILAGIKEGGEDLHTLKGLLEYQRFQRAGAGKFTTSLPVEIDGQANGPTIGGIQLLLSLPTIKNLGIAASEGMVFTENPVETDTVPYDPYQSIGAGWGALVNQLKKTMIAAKDTATYKRMEAAEFLLGKLTDSKGFLDKAVRKLAKNRAVGALYGSGHGKIKRGLVITIIEDGIKAKLEKILEDPTRPAAADELRELVRYTNTLANNPKALFIPANIAGVEGNLNKEALLKIKLNPSIYEDIAAFTNKYHGKALTQAIDKIYGDIQQARTPLNKAITIAAAFYNAAQKMLVQEHVAKFGSVMTQEQLQQIRDRIKKIFPVLKSSLGGKVPLAEFATNLEYTTAVEGTSTQSYQPDGSNVHYQPMHNRAKKLSTLGDPSVKPVIISVQNYDSSSANRAMGNNQGVGVLGVHDGFYVAITNGGAMGQIINKSLYTDMSLDSIPEKIVEAFTTSIEAFTEFANENPAREEKKDRVLQKVFKEMGLTEGVSSYNNKTWTKSVQQVVDETVNGVPEKGKRKKKFGIKEIVRVTKINKARVLNAVTAFNHYFHRDGAWKTGNAPQTSIGGVNIVETKTEPGLYSQATINQQALADYNLSVQELEEAFIAEMLKEDSNDSLGSKDDSTLSIDPAKYGRAQEISSKNVLEVYNDIKGESTVTDSVQHDNHLQRILKTLIHSVFQPVDLYMKTNPYAEPEGKFVSQTRQVFMTNQIAAPITGALNNGIRMSSGEVYTHELLHPVLEAGLRLNARLGAQVDTLYELAYRKLDYRAFLNDPTVNAAWLNDPANQYEIEAAQKRYNYIFRNTRTAAQRKASEQTDTATKITRESGHSPHLAEFVILGLTNENFLKALSGIALPERMYTTSTWSDIQAGNIQQTLLNIAQKIFDFFYSKFNASKNDLRMDRELERLAILLSKIDSNHKNKLFETQSKFEQQYRKVADLSNKYIKKAATSGPLKIVKGLKTAVKTHKDKDSLAGDQLRKMTNDYDRLEYGLFKSLVTELRGRTDRLAPIYQLLNRRGVWLDSAKEFTIAQYSGIAGKLFTKFRDPKQTKLTDAEKVVVTKIGLKPDTVALLDSLSMDGISKVLGDPNELRKAINNVLNQIKTDTALAPHLTYYKQAADAMGHFMIHSRGRTGEEVFQNALVIAEMKARDDVTVPLTAAEVLRAEELINQLGSLYALQHTDKASRQVFKELIDTDPEGVNKFFELHQVLKEDSLQKAFNGDERKFIKGYTKEIVNTRTNYQYGTLAEEEELAQIGYSRSEFPIDRDEADPLKHIDIYVYTAQTGRINDLLSTIFSYTGNRGKGTDPLTIAQQMDISTKEGKKNNAKIIKYKAKIIRDMANPNIKPELKPSNQMIPQVDENGITTKYRYMMAETTKDNFLEKVNEYDKIMGAMAGQIIDKERTPIINEELIVLLKDMFDADYQSNPGGFIEIGPNSPDPKLRDIYHMMPDKAKQTVDTVWGGPSMFIPKDVLDISFGYRQYNIVESFAKNPEDRAKLERLLIGIVSLFGGEVKGVRRAHTLEGAMIELAKLAKNNIIVRSLSVTLNNFGSNLFVLRSKGIPFNVIIKSAWEAFSMGLKYQADIQKLADLEVKRRMLAKRKGAAPQSLLDLDNQIMRLKNTIEINPTTKTIEAGLMPQFIDDVNTTISGSNFPSEFEKGVTKLTDKLPQIVQNVGKVTFLTQDTQAYQVLNNAVKMTDFVARHVLYHYYTSSARGDEQMSHEEAVAEAIEEFVNFAVPTHRMVEYLNSIGLLRFTKYAIRILKVIKNNAMDKPFDVAAALFLSTHIGADNINNSIPGVTKNMFSNFGNPFSFFVDSVDSILPVNYLKMFFSK